MFEFDEAYYLEQLKKLLAIDSTTGQFREIQDYLGQEAAALGYPCQETHKGGLIADLGGEGNSLVVTAHADDIGLMVRSVNEDGTLKVCPIGGLYPFQAMLENVRVYTRDGAVHTGVVTRTPNSIHLSENELRETVGDFTKDVRILLDAPVKKPEDVRAMGIEAGDIVALEPRFAMSNGYIKSRFLDDKACVAILLSAMKYLREGGVTPKRNVKFYFAMYEEIGHGTSWLPEGTKDVLALDIAPTGPDQNVDERKCAIFAKDSRYPYHWEMTNEVRKAAIGAGVDYVMDVVIPHYGTDCDCSISAGHDIRHAAFGPGTGNSHGYERMHLDGINASYQLALAYLLA